MSHEKCCATYGRHCAARVLSARTLTTFSEIPDLGARWTLVATYGGRQVHRVTVDRSDLAAANWTLTVPAGVTTALERAGYQ